MNREITTSVTINWANFVNNPVFKKKARMLRFETDYQAMMTYLWTLISEWLVSRNTGFWANSLVK